jgi:NADH:ubiquinone oxidoreductase subunit K
MYCQNCGAENPSAPAECVNCQQPLGCVVYVQQKISGLAIASFVLGLAGPFTNGVCALIGLPLGIVALVQINRSQGKLDGKGFAIAGIVISAVMIAVCVVMIIMCIPVIRAIQSLSLGPSASP